MTAKRVRAIVLRQEETKYRVFTTFGTAQIGTTGTYQPNYVPLQAGSPVLSISFLNDIPQSTAGDANSRVGNSIYVLGVDVSLTIQPAVGGMFSGGNIVRATCMHTKFAPTVQAISAGTAPVTNYQLKPFSIGQVTELNCWSMPLNRLLVGKVSFIKDIWHNMFCTSGTTCAPLAVYNFTVPVHKTIKYVANTPSVSTTYGAATIAAGNGIDCTNLQMEDYSISIVSEVACANVALQYRVRFKDA
jgi:hypothetical protein